MKYRILSILVRVASSCTASSTENATLAQNKQNTKSKKYETMTNNNEKQYETPRIALHTISTSPHSSAEGVCLCVQLYFLSEKWSSTDGEGGESAV